MKTATVKQQYLAYSTSPEDIEIVRSEGSYLFDIQGKRYIDFIMGWCVGNFGWGNEAIAGALKDFRGPEYIYAAFRYKGWEELAKLLLEITPGKLMKCYRTTGGTDSIETAMKIAMLYTGRKGFISVENCYHGNSIAALSIGSSSNKDTYPNLLSDCHKIQSPLDDNTLGEAEKLLKSNKIAGFVMEPVITHPGIHVPDKKFMLHIHDLCRKYGTLFILDEVATGFGRTGRIFGLEHFHLQPDILCMAKALSGGYAPIGAVMTTNEISDMVEEEVSAYPTYGWHPVSVQAAIASISYLIENRKEILSNVDTLSQFIRMKIEAMAFREEVNVNGLGLALSVNTGSDGYASEIARRCLDKGLLIEHSGSNLMLFPSLVMDRYVAEEGLRILEESL